MRTCARSGCSSPAVAILTYDRVALIAYLSSVDDPAARAPGDLCERHLGRLVLPRSWQLDDLRGRSAEPEVTRQSVHPEKKLRAVPATPRSTAPRSTPRAANARAPKPRASRQAAPRPKWSEVGPSLFDAPAPVAVEPPTSDDPTTTDPAWMPRFGPDSELEGVLDARTPLLRRAFGGR